MEYCEHNRKGQLLYGLYGRFRVYTCALDRRRGQEWLAGWDEPCLAQCTEHGRRKLVGGGPYRTRHWGFPDSKFPYKRITYDKIPFSEEALDQQKEEMEHNKAKAQKMRGEASRLIAEADKLEKATC